MSAPRRQTGSPRRRMVYEVAACLVAPLAMLDGLIFSADQSAALWRWSEDTK
jgi:hypothetical protein